MEWNKPQFWLLVSHITSSKIFNCSDLICDSIIKIQNIMRWEPLGINASLPKVTKMYSPVVKRCFPASRNDITWGLRIQVSRPCFRPTEPFYGEAQPFIFRFPSGDSDAHQACHSIGKLLISKHGVRCDWLTSKSQFHLKTGMGV